MKYGEHLTKCMTKGTPEEEKRKEDKIIAGLKKEMLIEMKEALTKAHAAKLIRKAKEKEEREKKQEARAKKRAEQREKGKEKEEEKRKIKEDIKKLKL